MKNIDWSSAQISNDIAKKNRWFFPVFLFSLLRAHSCTPVQFHALNGNEIPVQIEIDFELSYTGWFKTFWPEFSGGTWVPNEEKYSTSFVDFFFLIWHPWLASEFLLTGLESPCSSRLIRNLPMVNIHIGIYAFCIDCDIVNWV